MVGTELGAGDRLLSIGNVVAFLHGFYIIVKECNQTQINQQMK